MTPQALLLCASISNTAQSKSVLDRLTEVLQGHNAGLMFSVIPVVLAVTYTFIQLLRAIEGWRSERVSRKLKELEYSEKLQIRDQQSAQVPGSADAPSAPSYLEPLSEGLDAERRLQTQKLGPQSRKSRRLTRTAAHAALILSLGIASTFLLLAWVTTPLQGKIADALRELESAVLEEVSKEAKIASAMARSARSEASKAVAQLLQSDLRFQDAVKDAIAGLNPGGLPVGTVVAWPGPRPPQDAAWRVCDGSLMEVASSRDPLLLAIGNTYGDAPSGKVKLPDFRGMFLRGAGGSRKPGSRQSASKPSAPSITWYDHRITKDPVSKAMVVNAGHGTPGSYFSHLSLSPVDEDHRPVNYAVHWIIRVK